LCASRLKWRLGVCLDFWCARGVYLSGVRSRNVFTPVPTTFTPVPTTISPQVSMVTSILFWRLASSRFRSQDPTSPQHENPGQCLGFSALLPFLGAPLLRVVTQSYLPEVAYAQVVYGHDWMNLGNSVVPSLLAWLALHSRDNIAEGALVVIMGLCLLKALETILTLVATFSLDATLTLKEMWPEKKIKTVD
uniref:Uncharacterized protein n=1 Tax=Oncorhynchus kisutch TaxID=8019 RepID=A0A8C7JM06_ONCKI